MAPDTNATLGEFLRQERERRGITIEQVASATKISVRLLHLLESDNYAELPARPFVRGFVNSYCRFIGLDSKEVLTRFGEYIENHAADRPTREEGHSGYAFEKRDGDQSRMMLWIVLGTFMIGGGVVYVFLKPSLHHGRGSHVEKLRAAHGSPGPGESLGVVAGESPMPSGSPSPEVSPSPSAKPVPVVVPPPPPPPAPAPTKPSPSPSPKSTPTPKPTPSPAPSLAKGEKPDKLNSGVNLKPSELKYKLVFKALVHVWVRYQVDDRPMMKFILRKGSILVLRAKDTVKFQTSSPEGVTMSVNGGPYKVLSTNSNVAARENDKALILPAEDSATITDPFPGERSLLGAKVPLPASHE